MERAPAAIAIDWAAVEDSLDRSRPRLLAEDHALLYAAVHQGRALATTVERQAAVIREYEGQIVALETKVLFLSRRFRSEKGKDVLPPKDTEATPTSATSDATTGAAADGPADANPASEGEPLCKEGEPLSDAQAATSTAPAEPSATTSPEGGPGGKQKRRGHGRIATSAYVNAERFPLRLQEHLQPGCPCPDLLCSGTLYHFDVAEWLRIYGRAPLWGKCAELQQSRCSACAQVYTAQLPPEWQGPKYHESAVSIMAILHYGQGMPGLRLERLQAAMATPVPASTQWLYLNAQARVIQPVFDELRRLAAQGDFLCNDDTSARLLAFMGKRRAKLAALGKLEHPDRTGIFTTAFVSRTDAGPIVIFCTGRKHAGENFTALLELRAGGLEKPGHMCDGLDRNRPKGHEVDEGNCLSHARRHVVDQAEKFPAECAYVIEQIARVYAVDKRCKRDQLSKHERLQIHQRESGPIMDELKIWLTTQLREKRVEPNSGLGKAFRYMLKRWTALTLFLRRPGALLDNNICEAAFKRVIKYRKNSLFFLTERGAEVGDLYLSLIHTVELHQENPFDYLTALQVHAKAVADAPGDWMPWNFRKTLVALGVAAHAGAGVAAPGAPVPATVAAGAASAEVSAPTDLTTDEPDGHEAEDDHDGGVLVDAIGPPPPPESGALSRVPMLGSVATRLLPPALMFLSLLLLLLSRPSLRAMRVGSAPSTTLAAAVSTPGALAAPTEAAAQRRLSDTS